MCLLAAFTRCDRERAQPSPPRGPLALTKVSSSGSEVYPLARGDAYLINQFDEQLFYLAEGVAVRVNGVDLRGLDPTVYPLANGAAYLVSSDSSSLRLYYLVADKAIEVKEAPRVVPRQSSAEPSRDGFLWAQAQAANLRYQQQKDAIENPPPDDQPERNDP